MTRQRKTPKQRAEEALSVANRAVIALDKKVDRLTTDLTAVRREHAAAILRRDHLKQHPDLTTTPTTAEEPTE